MNQAVIIAPVDGEVQSRIEAVQVVQTANSNRTELSW